MSRALVLQQDWVLQADADELHDYSVARIDKFLFGCARYGVNVVRGSMRDRVARSYQRLVAVTFGFGFSYQ